MLDFPNNPAIGQKFPQPAQSGLPVWAWDGGKWTVLTEAAGVGATGPIGATGATGPSYPGTSITASGITIGPVTFATQAGLAYSLGARARVTSRGSGNWMEGVVTAYDSIGGALTLNVDLTSAMAASVLSGVQLPNYLGGLTINNNATAPNTCIDIAMGGAAASDNTAMLMMNAAFVGKNCNAAWVQGASGGALDVGSALAASTWYHVYLIGRTDLSATDILISQSATAPTLPTNWTKRRRIGSILTNASSAIVPFLQLGDQFLFTAPVRQYSNVGIGTTATALTMATPLGIRTEAIVSAEVTTNGPGYVYFYCPDFPAAQVNLAMGLDGPVTNAAQYRAQELRIRTNLNSQIITLAGPAAIANGFYISTLGWNDARGK